MFLSSFIHSSTQSLIHSLECTKFVLRRGSALDSTEGAYDAPQTPQSAGEGISQHVRYLGHTQLQLIPVFRLKQFFLHVVNDSVLYLQYLIFFSCVICNENYVLYTKVMTSATGCSMCFYWCLLLINECCFAFLIM